MVFSLVKTPIYKFVALQLNSLDFIELFSNKLLKLMIYIDLIFFVIPYILLHIYNPTHTLLYKT
jgi:hypothetical protein